MGGGLSNSSLDSILDVRGNPILLGALKFDGTLELLDRFGVALLIQKQLATRVGLSATSCTPWAEVYALIVLRFAAVGERPQRAAEGGHAVREVARLVLGNGKLDMAEDELVVQLRRLGVVLGSLLELVHDEQD